MSDNTTFMIDGVEKTFSIQNSPEFMYGKDEVLSCSENDVTFELPWYKTGFIESEFLSDDEFASLQNGLTKSIGEIIKKECSVDTDGFNLEIYHEYVTNNDDHFKVVSRTRDLFSEDFNFPVKELMPRFEKLLGFNLTDIDPQTKKQLHIIVRINRPSSNDYNPPHKDIYEGVDNKSYIPQFVNFWVPIAGVNEKSNLPIVPESHLINESQIHRTFEGGKIEGNQYRVRMIKSWNGKSDLNRATVKYGQVLIFSSHLIHGLAVNDNTDKTRVALEFRLFKA